MAPDGFITIAPRPDLFDLDFTFWMTVSTIPPIIVFLLIVFAVIACVRGRLCCNCCYDDPMQMPLQQAPYVPA
jgi:hypothetical protein